MLRCSLLSLNIVMPFTNTLMNTNEYYGKYIKSEYKTRVERLEHNPNV